jgi:hypothetical protein
MSVSPGLAATKPVPLDGLGAFSGEDVVTAYWCPRKKVARSFQCTFPGAVLKPLLANHPHITGRSGRRLQLNLPRTDEIKRGPACR